MNEHHHSWEPHTESADDNFCGQCHGYHHWNANCPEDDSVDDELISFEPITDAKPLALRVDAGGPVIHRVTAWRVPREASREEITTAMHYWMPPTFCYHEHDCCGNFYAGTPELLSRVVENNSTAIVFVMQRHTMNV